MSPVADHDPRNAGGGFAAALRASRLARGLTQDELAARSGLGVRTLRELERGRVARPQRNTLSLLADALNLNGPDREAFLSSALTPTQFNSGPHLTLVRPTQGAEASFGPDAPPDEDAPLAAPSIAARTALPLPTMPPLVGREADIAELCELLGTRSPETTRPAEAMRSPETIRTLEAMRSPDATRAPEAMSSPEATQSAEAARAPEAARSASPMRSAGATRAGEVIALIGMAGVGKTGLAHAVAHAAVADKWTAVSVTITNISQPTDIFSAVASVFGVARAEELIERFGAVD